jgi:hypothetical protein
MLPRLKQWLDNALRDAPAPRPADMPEEFLSTFMADEKLHVSESTITEFARTIAVYEPRQPGA